MYFAFMTDIIVSVLYCKQIRSDLLLCLSDDTWKEQCKLGWFGVSWSLSAERCGNVSELLSTSWCAHSSLRNCFVI